MQLHAASARGDTDGISFALAHGTEVNARNGSDQTALVFAFEQAKAYARRRGPIITIDAARVLLNSGADLEAGDGLGSTAIHHAVAIADRSFLDLLLEHGGDARHFGRSNYSVLTHACYQPPSPGKDAIVRKLHEAGASLDAASDYGEFPLGVCLYFGDLGTMRVLLELGANPGPLNWTPLYHAVAMGSVADLERIAPTPAEINAPNDRYHLSPWLLAFKRGDLGIIRWLAERGADLTATGRCGESLMHLAARFGHVDALHWLNELGADPNPLNEFGKSPLHEASEWNHVGAASALISFGANAKQQGRVGEQPIHAAQSLEMIQTLVELGGADVNVLDGCGEWPLKLAAEQNDVERIEWLLNHGAEVDLTSTGETALHAAVRHDSRESIALLLRAGANPNQQDVDGWTPLFSAQSMEAITELRKAGADPKITDQAAGGPEKWLKDPILLKALRGTL
jgi:cytohesin